MNAERRQYDSLDSFGHAVTNQLYRKNAEALLSGGLLAALMLAVLWGSSAPALLLGWFLLVELIYAGRYVLARAYRTSRTQHDKRWLNRFRIGVILQGLAWGGGSYLLFPSHHATGESGLLLAVVGLAAGAAIAYVIDEITLLGFQIPLLVPLFVRLLVEKSAHTDVMALMIIMYFVYIGVVIRRSYRPIRENIRLKLEADEREETIRKQNDFLNTILESEPESVKVIAADGELLQINQAGLSMLEADDIDEVRRTGLINFIMPEFRNAFSKLLRQVLRGSAGQLEFRIKGKHGTLRWQETHATPLRNAQEQVTGMVAVTRDVTERKQAMLALQESEHRFRTIMDNAPTGMVITSVDGHLLMVNQAYCDMLGYSKDELKGLTYMDITHPDDKTLTFAERQQLLNEEINSYRKEKRYLHKNGKIVRVLLTSSVVKSTSGTDPYFIAQVEDVTERKQAEAKLRQSETEYRHLIEMLPYGILIHRAGDILQANKAAAAIFGATTPDELVGHPILQLVHPDYLDVVKERIRAAVELGRDSGVIEEKLVRLDGTPFHADVAAISVLMQNQPASLVVLNDISQRKRHEQQLVQSEQRLQEILNVSPIAVRIATQQGRKVVFCNQAYIKLIRNTHAIGDDPRNYYARAGDYDEILAKLAQGSAVIDRQIELHVPDDTTVWALASYMPIRYRDEAAVLGWFYDITEIKKSEAEIRIAATAFESQEGMLITDAAANILRVNSAFTAITGYTAAEVIGKNPRLLSSGHQDRDFYAELWHSLEDTGVWEGEIWNRRKNGEIYPERLTITTVRDQHGSVTNYVASMSDITMHKRSEEEIQRLAYYDHLTDLPNRRMLMDRLQHALSYTSRNRKHGALLFIDLDNFKILNDTLGHALGDMLLQQVAQRLASCVREGDTVARFGGDEFVLMLDDLSEQPFEASEQAKTTGEKIAAALARPYQLANHEFTCTPSIGITLFHGRDQDVEDLLKQADIAMYQAKNAGRNTLRFFDSQMQESINARALLEAELRNALERNQFRLYYQLQKTSQDKTFGVEALIRWHHPERGPISPAQFIPVAEETGLILPIGAWVIETACAQLKAWARDQRTRSLVLAVNVSAKQFHQTNFSSQIQEAIGRHVINPGLLKLELTESMLLENVEDTIATMHDLNEIGVQLALDDFGTGYSSLQYLKRLPLDQLKIDQSFVRDIAFDSSDLTIVHTIIAMAHSLNLDVIAEGVETEEQRRLLLDSGCTHYQGYLFGKPVPIELFDDSLKQD